MSHPHLKQSELSITVRRIRYGAGKTHRKWQNMVLYRPHVEFTGECKAIINAVF